MNKIWLTMFDDVVLSRVSIDAKSIDSDVRPVIEGYKDMGEAAQSAASRIKKAHELINGTNQSNKINGKNEHKNTNHLTKNELHIDKIYSVLLLYHFLVKFLVHQYQKVL